MTTPPNGTVTFLFSDIEGSTRLASEHPAAWKAMHARHDILLREAIESQLGYIFHSIGDAFHAAFHTAGDALRAAMQAQTRLQAEPWGQAPIRVRMGIHTGQAELLQNGDYSGYLPLSRLQRLTAAGHGGQVLLSLATQELVRDDLPAGASLRDLGMHRLKDLIHPEHIFQVDIPGLPADLPALRTLSVQLNNLPGQVTPFVGREREIAAVLGLLRTPQVRLLTLSGAGGTGKTRLSIQVAAELLDEFQHGVWLVELASIRDPDLFLPTVSAALKVNTPKGTPIAQTLHEHLQARSLLLVLDNFEQIVRAAPQISALLNAAPRVKVLVSSREVLHLRGEHDYPVPPLGLPEPGRRQTAAVLAQYEAVALFGQHARAANPAFELDEENAPLVAEICSKLDGLPLAIELAAARSRMLRPAAMLEKMKSRLTLLTGGARDLPQRQQTIRGAIDWSYDLLEEGEKVLFARLGVFVGGCTAEAAGAVCGPGLSIDVLVGLESLLDKSLLRQAEGRSGEMRLRMLETIREYALEKLAQGGERAVIQQAQADHIERLLDQTFGVLNGPEEGAWFTKLDDEIDNLRSALETTLERGQPGLAFKAGRLYQYWNQRANYREPLGWLERGLEMEAGRTVIERARARISAGNLLVDLGDPGRARGYYESALNLFREADDPDGIAICLNNLGNIAWKEKDFETARRLYEQVGEIRRSPDSWGQAMTLNNLGSLARIRGEYPLAFQYYSTSRQICERLGADAGVSFADYFLGRLALCQGRLEEARGYVQSMLKAEWLKANPLIRRLYEGYLGYIALLEGNIKDARPILDGCMEALLDYMKQTPEVTDGWMFLDAKARLELGEGRPGRAAQLFGASWTQRAYEDCLLTEAERPGYEACLTQARSSLGQAAFDDAFKRGEVMSFKNAVAFAAGEPVP